MRSAGAPISMALTVGLPSLIPAYGGPGSFVDVVEDHFCGHLGPSDRAGELRAAGKNVAQRERIDAARDSPAHRLGDGAGM